MCLDNHYCISGPADYCVLNYFTATLESTRLETTIVVLPGHQILVYLTTLILVKVPGESSLIILHSTSSLGSTIMHSIYLQEDN